jgi:sec-independent protein translocase protein TatA
MSTMSALVWRCLMVAMFEMPGGGEWIVIAVIVALLFGARRLPDIARNSGKALVEFKKAIGELRPADDQTANQTGQTAQTAQTGQTQTAQADPAASQASQHQPGASGASGRSAAE